MLFLYRPTIYITFKWDKPSCFVCVRMSMPVHTCVHVRVCVCTCARAHTHTHTHTSFLLKKSFYSLTFLSHYLSAALTDKLPTSPIFPCVFFTRRRLLCYRGNVCSTPVEGLWIGHWLDLRASMNKAEKRKIPAPNQTIIFQSHCT